MFSRQLDGSTAQEVSLDWNDGCLSDVHVGDKWHSGKRWAFEGEEMKWRVVSGWQWMLRRKREIGTVWSLKETDIFNPGKNLGFCGQDALETPTQICANSSLSSSFILPPYPPYFHLLTPTLHHQSTSVLSVSLDALSWCCLPESTLSYSPEIYPAVWATFHGPQ